MVPMRMEGKLMLGKRSMGIRLSEVAPSSTMASEAMSTAMPLRRARRVSHMGRLPPRRGYGPPLLPRLHAILALDHDPVAPGETPLDPAPVGHADVHGHGLRHPAADGHHGGLALAEAEGLHGDDQRGRAPDLV